LGFDDIAEGFQLLIWLLILAIKALKPGNCKVFDLSGNIKQGLAYATNCN